MYFHAQLICVNLKALLYTSYHVAHVNTDVRLILKLSFCVELLSWTLLADNAKKMFVVRLELGLEYL